MASVVIVDVAGTEVVCRATSTPPPRDPDVVEPEALDALHGAAWVLVHVPLHRSEAVLDAALRLVVGRAAAAECGLVLHVDDPSDVDDHGVARFAPLRAAALAGLGDLGIAVRTTAAGGLRYLSTEATFVFGRSSGRHPTLVASHLVSTAGFDPHHCDGDQRLVELGYLPGDTGFELLASALHEHERRTLSELLT